MSPRRARVVSLPDAGEVALSTEASHHLLHVLRLSVQAEVVLFDGRGNQALGRIVAIDQGRATIRLVEVPSAARPERDAHLLLAQIKPKGLDLALRMGVEVGLTHVHVFAATRSQGRPPRPDRWTKILEAAATQCGRADLPQVTFSSDLRTALDLLPDGITLFLALPGADRPEPPTLVSAAIVGPEGGLTQAEIHLSIDQGAHPLGLGAWTLRAETAAALAAGFVCPPR
ncbi:MAG: 16S rRNA (uracil(1498)-N(3))-methyltransferase [Deltaproteobacteria bacterium]|nr:MAG: 16S rRNA (uracil(1498)-N(3))-methyltransferase [Deltaproteobacteria bacterium]